MARQLRLEFSGALYHITSRGDRREDIFYTDSDRVLFLELLEHTCQRYNWICHAYCLMSNHYHLIIETLDGNLSKGMRQLNGVYTQKINRKYEKVGHLFQGRFKSILVDKESYLLELSRYVVLNPVRARMVSTVNEWLWSSYKAMTGESPVPVYLETDWVLSQFSDNRQQAIESYINFVHQGLVEKTIWNHLNQAVYLGNEDFINEVHKKAGILNNQLSEIPKKQKRSPANSIGYYEKNSSSRDEAMARAYLTGAYNMKEIGEYFQVHYVTVSRAVKKFEKNNTICTM